MKEIEMKHSSLSIFVLSAFLQSAYAIPLDLAHPTLPIIGSTNIGDTDRSVVFDATADFSIMSAGIVFEPIAAPGQTSGGVSRLGVEIYDMSLTGGVGSRNSLLASANTDIVRMVGRVFYDVPISFSFQAGTRYNVAFDAIIPPTWGQVSNLMDFYAFDFPDTPYDVGGVLTVLDGGADGALEFANSVMPHVRFDGDIPDNGMPPAVPEPATLVLLGFGLAGLGFSRWRLH